MAKLTDDQLLAIVNSEFRDAQGVPGGEIADERAKAWDYYLSKKRGDEVDGESQIVSSDVSDVVDGIMPSLLRIFTTADNLVSFDAVGPEDEAAAEQESDYVNYVFFKQNPAFLLLFYWIFDGLLQKNGFVKAYWDDSKTTQLESYRGLSEPELLELLSDDELEPVDREERQAETVDPMTGQIVMTTVHDITFRKVTSSGKARVEVVPPSEYRISRDSRSLDPSGARMVGHERNITRSELLEMGFDEAIVEELPAETDSIESPEELARRDRVDEQSDAPKDKSQDKIRVREAYIKVDFDGDGKSELRQVFTAGNKLLSNEEVDRQPFHVICPHPLPHKHFGRAAADKVLDLQDVGTALTRQVLTNLYHTNRPGHAVWEQGLGDNTMDELLTTRTGRVATFRRPVAESYAPLTVPFTAGATFPMLEYFEKVKRDRTGIAADGEGLSPEALKNIQTTVLAQAVDQSKMKIEAIARIFAETGIKSLFLHLHELLLKHQKKAQVVKLRNQWVQVDPRAWRTRSDMTVNIGLGIGTREQNLLHLQAIWDKQVAMVEAGGMNLTVTPRNIFNTAAEIVKNANLKQPTMFFTDPGDKPAPPPSDEQMQLQQMQAQIQARQQELDAQKQQLDMQRQQIEMEKTMLEHQRELGELQRKRDADEDSFTVEMEKIRTKLTELELNSAQNVPGSHV